MADVLQRTRTPGNGWTPRRLWAGLTSGHERQNTLLWARAWRTGAEEFVAAIMEENHVGANLHARIVHYRDGQGQTISQRATFLCRVGSPPAAPGLSGEVIDMAQAQERAKWLINAYCMEVF